MRVTRRAPTFYISCSAANYPRLIYTRGAGQISAAAANCDARRKRERADTQLGLRWKVWTRRRWTHAGKRRAPLIAIVFRPIPRHGVSGKSVFGLVWAPPEHEIGIKTHCEQPHSLFNTTSNCSLGSGRNFVSGLAQTRIIVMRQLIVNSFKEIVCVVYPRLYKFDVYFESFFRMLHRK